MPSLFHRSLKSTVRLYASLFHSAVELSILFKNRFPRARGQTLAHILLKRCQPQEFAPGMVVRDGRAWYISDLRNNSEEAIYYGVPQDVGVKPILRSLVRPGDVVVDIGANIGYYTAFFSELVGSSGRVYAFEASPYHFQTLERNFSLQQAPNVFLRSIAISDAEGQRAHYTWPSSGSLVSDFRQYGMDSVQLSSVSSAPLDAVLPPDIMERVRLIKIDVDGNEIEVIRGARETIKVARPILFVEVSERAQKLSGRTAMDLLSAIEQLGYAFVLQPDQTPVAPDALLPEIDRTPVFVDVIGMPIHERALS